MSSSPSYLDPVILPLIVGATVLDAGCGFGRWSHLIASNFWEAGLAEPPLVDGFDAFPPNVERCRRGNSYRRVWQQTMPSPLEGTWDTVLACEFIEHIEQDQVEEVLTTLEGAARRRVVLSTPNWRYERGGLATGGEFNEYEAHRSYVARDALRDRGYTLRGAGWGNPTSRVVRVGKRLHLAGSLHSVPRRIPWLGEVVVAFKDIP